MKRATLAITILAISAFSFIAASAPSEQASFDRAAALEAQGKFNEAYDVLSQIKTEFPNSNQIASAEYRMGLMFVYDNHPVEAALQFQHVISRFPNSDEARMALNMNAILYRLYIAPATNKTIFQPDSSYSATIADLDDPSGISVDPDGNAILSDRGKKILYTLDPAGKMTNSSTILSPYFSSVTPNKQILIANDQTVYVIGGDNLSFAKINPSTQAKAGYLEEIRSVSQNAKGEYFVVSGKSSGIAVFDRDKNPLPARTISPTVDFIKVALSPRGYIYALSKKGEFAQAFDPDGKSLFTISKSGGEMNFGKFEDLALDAACNIYLLTDNPRGIAIYSPQGKYLKYLGSDKKTTLSFDDARAIAVGPTGSIYVVDKSTKRIMKLG
jgi:WD40 repeat protein